MRMLKIIIVFTIVLLLVFFLYKFNIDTKIYYVSIGDSLTKEKKNYATYFSNYLKKEKLLKEFVNNYSKTNYYIPNIINDIKLNEKTRINNKEIGFKQVLSQADLITLSAGNSELMRSINSNLYEDNLNQIYEDIDIIVQDLNDLLKVIREYYKKEIIIIGYYYLPIEKNTNEIDQIFNYINKKITNLKQKHNINYIDVHRLLRDKNFLYNPKSEHFSSDVHKQINSKIINIFVKLGNN